ncbi:MAG: cation:proton antiporter [Rhodospirillaceae bacterium]
MEHAADLSGMATIIITALMCGMLMVKLGHPPLVGYLLAGIILGPTGLGLVKNEGMITHFAELGVLLLLFIIGMELSVRTLKFTWRIALPAVAMQSFACLIIIFFIAWAIDIPARTAVLLGFVVALSSTAVAVKMLEEIKALRNRVGRVTVAILIAQDLAFLPMILIVENMGKSSFSFGDAGKFIIAILLLALLIKFLLRQGRAHLPFYKWFSNHSDLSPLAGLLYCFGGSALLGLMGLSPAYGAFLAGLAVGNSAERREMLSAVRPIQSVMLMVFFLSIGLLIDLGFIWRNIGTVFLFFLIVTFFKTGINVIIIRALGENWQRAFLSGVMISQIGEFSFLLAAAGLTVGAISVEESRLVITVTALSLGLSPFWLSTARRLQIIASRGVGDWNKILSSTFVLQRALFRWLTRRTRPSIKFLITQLKILLGSLRNRK